MENVAVANQRRILVLEDDTAISELLELVLSECGYQVETADSLRQARKLCKRQLPDLVIADLFLPDGLGTDLVRDLAESRNDRRPPAIILSALSQAKNHARSVDADRFYMKPFDVDELQTAASDLLGSRRKADRQVSHEYSSVAAG